MLQVKVFGVPYEGLQNFQKGAQLAPSFVRYHFASIEYYSVLQNKKLKEFIDLGDFYPPLDLKGKDFFDFLVGKLSEYNMLPPFVAIGGDHFISYPIIYYLNELDLDFTVVHFDAHMDRRPEFEGEVYNHATFMYHVEKLMGKENVITVGVRTKAPCEKKDENIYFAWEEYQDKLLSIKTPIYLTLDLDMIDPSEFPGVTNPEPGGASVMEVVKNILSLKKILAADIVEFSPFMDFSANSATKAAFILREILIKLQHEL